MLQSRLERENRHKEKAEIGKGNRSKSIAEAHAPKQDGNDRAVGSLAEPRRKPTQDNPRANGASYRRPRRSEPGGKGPPPSEPSIHCQPSSPEDGTCSTGAANRLGEKYLIVLGADREQQKSSNVANSPDDQQRAGAINIKYAPEYRGKSIEEESLRGWDPADCAWGVGAQLIPLVVGLEITNT